MIVIGICGVAGSGKDTAADYLRDNYGFTKIGLADPMKKICAEVFDFSQEQLHGPSSERERVDTRYVFTGICPRCHERCIEMVKPTDAAYWYCDNCALGGRPKTVYPKYVTPRLALQTLGTEWGRTLFNTIWIDTVFRNLRRAHKYVISDVRYKNEVQGITDHGGRVLRLLRGTPRFNHPSETELGTIPMDLFDVVIDNDRELSFLYTSLDDYMKTRDISKTKP